MFLGRQGACSVYSQVPHPANVFQLSRWHLVRAPTDIMLGAKRLQLRPRGKPFMEWVGLHWVHLPLGQITTYHAKPRRTPGGYPRMSHVSVAKDMR